MFKSREIATEHSVATLQLGGSSLSYQMLALEYQVRRKSATQEVRGTGGGALLRGIDCNSCNYVNTCHGDRCRRLDN